MENIIFFKKTEQTLIREVEGGEGFGEVDGACRWVWVVVVGEDEEWGARGERKGGVERIFFLLTVGPPLQNLY